MTDLEIFQFPCLQDNFGVLIHDDQAGVTASIDAPEADAVRRALEEKGWSLTHILVTHHHYDHTDGIEVLKLETGCLVVGPKNEADRIPTLDVQVLEGDDYSFGNFTATIFETPGHTSGHIIYWFKDAGTVFTGDTLFSLGCGRLFERPADVMWDSLQKIMALPRETVIYCGHEYSQANGVFALTIEPENEALQSRVEEIRKLRASGKATLPTTLERELDTNPFLRASSPEIRKRLDMEEAEDEQVFTELRARKDRS